MFLMVGLGNPGKEYEHTRHNLGFMAIDAIKARFAHSESYKEKCHAHLLKAQIGTVPVILLKPLTYMNLSGKSVQAAAHFFKIPSERVIVFHDDLDLAVGKVRVKTGGGAAGHNGIRDIDQQIGNHYQRVRIGIQHPGAKEAVRDYVLDRITSDDAVIFDTLLERIAEHCQLLLDEKPDCFMTRVMDKS